MKITLKVLTENAKPRSNQVAKDDKVFSKEPLEQGSQTQVDWRATFQRKIAPHFIGEKAYAGRKLQENL